MSGYVYLIGTPIFKWYKIGKSATPEIRIQNLGILLPFKIKVIGIWKAADHTTLESILHKRYSNHRINGEWFEFVGHQVKDLFQFIPDAAKIFPTENNPDSVFATFSNIEEDVRQGKRIIGVRKERLRGDFTPEERLRRRQKGILKNAEKRAAKEAQIKLL